MEVMGKLNNGVFNESAFFDIASAGGKEVVKKVTDLQQYCNENGDFELSLDFVAEKDLENCEFRLYVNEGVELEVESVTLERVKAE